ncbi:class I SAM-dependent DNA methyltransferase [Bernardetia sp.]|uniref:class I SAM-dependent DNA methyltransferase n=1 Tax=Bernardetia sp. TaxID=1937974 RepID=UPI0025C528A4|nr:DNA methyltransferase [Bernardetia sp.]
MNITQIENNLTKLIKNFKKESFIYQLLLAYNLPKATITRLKKGTANLSKIEGEISLKKKLFFKEIYNQDLHLAISNLAKEIKHDQRFVIVTDYDTFLAKDTKTNATLDIQLKELPKHYDFFLPWAGMEKAQLQNENPADVKAAVKMAKLFDEIKKDNEDTSTEFIQELNVFLSRLLFCFFAEDTNIFQDNQFTNAIASHTQTDGSDLNNYLDKLFEVLNTPQNNRKELPAYLDAFPYVNGGLFAKKHKVPKFSAASRKTLLESGNQDWSAINPDIFGSMFQAVISEDQRGSLGQHYTSVPNIMKVIEPLFLNELKEEFEKAKGNDKKLSALLKRLQSIKIFDPACGSGNFLIIAYKELRKLEMEIFKETKTLALSQISLSNFYGIELDDFAQEIAILALWLTKHQMDVVFFKEFGKTNPTLPLTEAGNIVQGNACRLDWEKVCPKKENDEIYILGNPPYLGYSVQNSSQKEDMSIVFKSIKKEYKSLDYISCWFYKGANFIHKTNSQCAFVSTNSICQGEQVALLWSHILAISIEIGFAYTSFKWINNAKHNAGVICVIVGLRNKCNKQKYIYEKGIGQSVQNISPYLTRGNDLFVEKRSNPLSPLPKIGYGSSALDGGSLILSTEEKEKLILNYPEAAIYVLRIMGSQELIKGIDRWCLWIEDSQIENVNKIPPIKDRILQVENFRKKLVIFG